MDSPRLLGIGTSVPATSYSQPELLRLLGLENRVARRVFGSTHIGKRHLLLAEVDPATGRLRHESQAELNKKFGQGALAIGREAIDRALSDAGLTHADVSGLVCVTSTGWMVPGLSALYLRELKLATSCQRIDVVGMGCNAGLNALSALDGWARRNPGKVGLLVCCEINSAIYCLDDTAQDAIVNSLFGDGAAALVVRAGPPAASVVGPAVVDFESHTIPEHWDAMRFDWHEGRSRWRFFLSKDIPYVLGVHAEAPIERLLARHRLRRADIDHWLIHTGGGAVIDALKLKLGLSEQDVRHTRSVLKDYGNLSSGSFLFSYERLAREHLARPGDHGVMMSMGPGAQIEAALLRW